MKIYYYFSNKRKPKDKAVVVSIYGENTIITSDEPSVLINNLERGDILICNSIEELMVVNQAHVDIEEIVNLYMALMTKGVDLTFDKSAQCNSLFIKTLISDKDEFEAVLRKCIINYLGQKNVEDKYSKKHVVTANKNGNKVGIKKGTKLVTKKSIETKKVIIEQSKDFQGNLNDNELIEKLKIGRNTYYKYKKELIEGGNYGNA